MVVIEPVANEVKVELPPESSSCKENEATTAAAGYASDGFETASENDHQENDDDDDGGGGAETNHTHKQSMLSTDHSYQDSLNDDELKQKSLEEANDAKLEGNKLFGDAQYEEALLKYDQALQLVSEMPSAAELRSICHSNRATCFFKLVVLKSTPTQKALNMFQRDLWRMIDLLRCFMTHEHVPIEIAEEKYEDSIKECKRALDLNPTYMKALLRRAEAHEKLEHYDEAVADMTKILEMNPSNLQAKRSIVRLEPLAREKHEKMKEEMIGKLKEMGNSILGKFGMSVDNFKAVQDPNTGSYSISFQR